MRKMHNGRCSGCGMLFIGMSRYEYNWSVTKHLRERHGNVDADGLVEKI